MLAFVTDVETSKGDKIQFFFHRRWILCNRRI